MITNRMLDAFGNRKAGDARPGFWRLARFTPGTAFAVALLSWPAAFAPRFFLLIDRNIVLGLCSFAILFLCVCDVPARAQSTVTVTVTIIGPITPGVCAVFNSTTVIKDFGSTGCTGGGGGSPGGSNGQVQFNNAGSFGGLSNVQPSAFVQQPARCRRPAAAQPISRALMGLLQLRQPPRSLASSDGLVLWPPRAATTTRGK